MVLFRCICVFALACTAIHAPPSTGAIRGVVTDPSGASVANVTVTATNGTIRSTLSNARIVQFGMKLEF